MILHITILLCFQLAGELISRALGLLLPGPVLGMVLLLFAFALFPKLAQSVRDTAQGLLAHLSLLFVPAGVGVVGHIDKLGSDGIPVLIAIFISTVFAIIAGVYVFIGASRLMGPPDV